MLTSNVQLGYVLTRGGGQAVQGGLSCPPPRISKRMDNPQILSHHLLQEYLVERDINFISVNLRCFLQMFSWVTYWEGEWGQAVQGGLSCPPPRISERIDNTPILSYHLLKEKYYFVLVLFQSTKFTVYYRNSWKGQVIAVKLRCLLQTFSWVTYWQGVGGGRASCPGRFILASAQNFK